VLTEHDRERPIARQGRRSAGDERQIAASAHRRDEARGPAVD